MAENPNNPDPKKRGLGRGLDAIFGEDSNMADETTVVSHETESESDVSPNDIISDDLKRRTMPIEWLRPCPFQPRKHFDQEALDDLAKSIRMHGILQPIVVRPVANEERAYEIIAGERRWRAAQLVQMHTVPVVLQYLDDETVLEIALIENLQREDLTPIEEAKALKKLMDIHGHTQEKLSATIGKSRPYIANVLRLLQLPPKVQTMVEEGELSAGHARALIGRDNAEILAQRVIDENLSVRAVEKIVQENDVKHDANKKGASKSSASSKDVNTIALEEEITRILGMSVTIQAASKSGQGSVKIQYKNFDQLDDVIHRLSKGSQ